MPFSTKIQKEATPKRVYSLLKLVEYKTMKKEKLEKLLMPSGLSKGNNSPFLATYKFAEKAKLIKTIDSGGIVLDKISCEDLKDWKSYKMFMAKLLFSNEESNFLKLTWWYLGQGREVLNYSSSEDIQKYLKGDLGGFTENDVLGWRFWIAFLGLGILSDRIILPNPYQRLRDIIEEDKLLNRDKEIPISEFIDFIINNCNELKSCIKGNNINFGLSNGLRTLHDQKCIELIMTNDSSDVWHLYKMEHEIAEDITGVKIIGGKNE